jgi:hypothetical protein
VWRVQEQEINQSSRLHGEDNQLKYPSISIETSVRNKCWCSV